MRNVCLVELLGLMEYGAAWHYQETLAREIGQGRRAPTLLLLEHPHTFTFGRRGQEQHLLWDAAELQRRGVAVFWVDRGGDVTYHGPGQLVGYPLLRLKLSRQLNQSASNPADENGISALQIGYVDYLRKLEEAIILALSHLGVTAQTVKGKTGVWTVAGQRPAKIAAIGVKVDAQGITRHGFAINVSPNMEYWDGIVGCGLTDERAGSLAEILDPPPVMEQVIAVVAAAFGEVFGFEMTSNQAETE